ARLAGLGRAGQDLGQVAHGAEVDELDERRLLVLVDRDDRLRGLHAGPVLDGTGDARGDVELRGDRLAGLADLEGVRHPARVDGGTGGADRRTERAGEALDRGEVATGATATGDHDRGLGELGAPGRLARLGLDHLRGLRGVGDGHADLLLGAGGADLLRSGGVGLDRDDRGALGDLAGDGEVAGEDRLGRDRRTAVAGDIDRVGDDAGADLDRQATGDLLA